MYNLTPLDIAMMGSFGLCVIVLCVIFLITLYNIIEHWLNDSNKVQFNWLISYIMITAFNYKPIESPCILWSYTSVNSTHGWTDEAESSGLRAILLLLCVAYLIPWSLYVAVVFPIIFCVLGLFVAGLYGLRSIIRIKQQLNNTTEVD